jgi:hypothetical protein
MTRAYSIPRLPTALSPANDEMVAGYLDGFDLDNPEPSANRSHSYRHGFANGRADKTAISRGYTADRLRLMAEEAMAADLAASGRMN